VEAPSGERLRGKADMVFIADKTVSSMPERFRVVCSTCKALYKCSALPVPFLLAAAAGFMSSVTCRLTA